jgi:site-specific DNA-methyltransferase (adenine-specific)
LDHEIKEFITSIDAVPVERNKGLDGIYSSNDGLIGIRFQRQHESIADGLTLMEKASREKPIAKKIIVKTNDSQRCDYS